jgi:iron complex transport system ATP-binding protein
MITHHVEEIPEATTHVLLLRDGMCVKAGPIAEVLTSEHVSATFGLPVTVERAGPRWTAHVTPR